MSAHSAVPHVGCVQPWVFVFDLGYMWLMLPLCPEGTPMLRAATLGDLTGWWLAEALLLAFEQ